MADWRQNIAEKDLEAMGGIWPPKYEGVSKWDGTLWDSKLWYPKGITWEDVEWAAKRGVSLAQPRDLYMLPFVLKITHHEST